MSINLVNLPDDCLISIFKELNVFDLLSVHITCRRLHTIGKYCINLLHNTVFIELIDDNIYNVQINGTSSCRTTVSGLLKLFKQIGKSISFLKLQGQNSSNTLDAAPIFDMVDEHCGERLKALSLLFVAVEKNSITKYRNVFKRLEKLHLEGKSGLAKFVTYPKNLRELTITTSNAGSNVFLTKNYPNLGMFNYCFGKNTRVTTDDAAEFFKNHPNLKCIRLWKVLIPIPQCLNHLQNVETLLIDLDPVSVADLQRVDWITLFQLKNLKTLQLVLNEHDLGPSLNQVKRRCVSNIECLDLKIYHFKDVSDLLNTFIFNNLKELKITFDLISLRTIGEVSPEMIQSFSQNLRNIESLAFKDFPKDFYKLFILELVRNSPNLKVLTLFPIFMQEITADDLLCLTRMNISDRPSLTVNFGNCLNVIVKLVTSKAVKDPHVNILVFKPLEQTYEW